MNGDRDRVSVKSFVCFDCCGFSQSASFSFQFDCVELVPDGMSYLARECVTNEMELPAGSTM
jgi:hypothetical protein